MQESKTCWDVHQYWFLSIQLRSLSCPVMLDWELSHITEEGKNAIAYVSQPLASAEQNYPHLEKEGLTIIFGVKKNHQYLYGYKFFYIYGSQTIHCVTIFLTNYSDRTYINNEIQWQGFKYNLWLKHLFIQKYERNQRFLFWNAPSGLSGFNTRLKIWCLRWFCIATDNESTFVSGW